MKLEEGIVGGGIDRHAPDRLQTVDKLKIGAAVYGRKAEYMELSERGPRTYSAVEERRRRRDCV